MEVWFGLVWCWRWIPCTLSYITWTLFWETFRWMGSVVSVTVVIWLDIPEVGWRNISWTFCFAVGFGYPVSFHT